MNQVHSAGSLDTSLRAKRSNPETGSAAPIYGRLRSPRRPRDAGVVRQDFHIGACSRAGNGVPLSLERPLRRFLSAGAFGLLAFCRGSGRRPCLAEPEGARLNCRLGYNVLLKELKERQDLQMQDYPFGIEFQCERLEYGRLLFHQARAWRASGDFLVWRQERVPGREGGRMRLWWLGEIQGRA